MTSAKNNTGIIKIINVFDSGESKDSTRKGGGNFTLN
jgi:hypothetical protein